MNKIALLYCIWTLVGASAQAAEIYRQDFQKGAASEWVASEKGAVQISEYAGNRSLKFSNHARSVAIVHSDGRRNVVVRSKIAALHLLGTDGCYTEVSADDGATWLTALAVHKGQDTGVGLVAGVFADARLDGRAMLLLRFRADLSNTAAACWGDAVTVSADLPGPRQTRPLDLAMMSDTRPLDGLSPTVAFEPGDGAVSSPEPIRGTLELLPAAKPDGMIVLTDTESPRPTDTRATWPALSVSLVQDGDRLIPAEQGPLASPNADWEWLLAPGRTWMQPGDHGLIRAVLPVALQERNANCVHNGRLLVLLDPKGGPSKAVIQIDQEDCAYYKFDAWSRVRAVYHPGAVGNAQALVARDRKERASRVPLRPLSALADDYAGIDLQALTRAAGPFAEFGIDDGRNHYAAPCSTRAGDDPLCDERHLPSYSTAKTLVAAQALLRLEKLKPGASLEKIAAHVPACAKKGGWQDVRLIDMLDMSSGHFNSELPQADEDAPAIEPFFTSESAAEKIDFACNVPRKAAPGKKWVYHTFDTFLLGVAMTDVLRKAGLGNDIYNDLILPIWRATDQSPALDSTRRTYDSIAQPFAGWGLIYHRDDILRAARFLKGEATIGQQPYFDRGLLDEAMQRATPGGGFEAIAFNLRYRHGLWARNVGLLIGCSHPVWAPYMSGFGGISVVMFPNGITYYAFNDDDHFDWAAAVPEIDKMRKLCTSE